MPKMKSGLAYSYGYSYGGNSGAQARQPYAFTSAGPEIDVLRQQRTGPSGETSQTDDGRASERPPAD